MIGTRLGPYEIASKVGEGGMGTVYKARDTRLGRTVAVKVLSAQLAPDADARARFEREARAISSLSHPHICALFDVGHDGETEFLVMEFLEGESLAHRLARGPLPLDQTLRFGGQIAAALEAAHRQGIVHRDLKPGNIMLTTSGVKLLDFGLAKLHTAPPRNLSRSSIATHPTELAPGHPLTVEGSFLGTPLYMAPEQVEGREIDTRADLWALGCVLYEMATGRRPFDGTSPASIVAAILGREPPSISTAAPLTPPALDRLVRNCLVKNPDARWQSAFDAALELEGMARVGNESNPDSRAPRRGAPWLGLASLGALLLVGAGGIWLGRRGESAATVREVRFQVPPPPRNEFPSDVENVQFGVSPDGLTLAFVGVEAAGPSRIWLRRSDDLEARPLAGTEGARSIAWSPDGRAIAFFAGDKLKRLELAGGGAVPICDVPPGVGLAGSWGGAGQILFATITGDAIYRVSAAGGVAEKILEPDQSRNEFRTSWPRYLADGRAFLYLMGTVDLQQTLMLVEPDHPPRAVGPLASRFEVIAPDLLIFAREGALLGQRFDRAAARLVGAPISIAPAVRYFYSSGWAGFATSPGGTIFLRSHESASRLVWFGRDGRSQGSVGPEGNYQYMRLAPNGRAVLADRMQPGLGTHDLWQIDLERGVETRLTSAPNADFAALDLLDGKNIVYSSLRGRAPNLVRRDLTTGEEAVLLPRAGFQVATDVTRDGTRMAFVERGEDGKFHAWTLRLAGEPRAERLFAAGSGQADVRFSPDGNFVAYRADDSGQFEAYVSPLASPHVKTKLAAQAVRRVIWGGDGSEIFLLTADRQMLSVPIRTSPRLEVGAPSVLFTLAPGAVWLDFDVVPDGRRFLATVLERSGAAQPATVILNWKPGAVAPGGG